MDVMQAALVGTPASIKNGALSIDNEQKIHTSVWWKLSMFNKGNRVFFTECYTRNAVTSMFCLWFFYLLIF